MVANLGLLLFLAVAVWALWPSTLGGCTTLTIVSGHSMDPTYATGDLVVARCGEPAVGDVVVYQPATENGGRVIHRIIGGDAEAGWRMQGDNNDFTDPWMPTADEVLGVARLHLPQVGVVASILLMPLTWVSLLVVAAAILLWPSRAEDADAGALEPADATAPADFEEDAR
ncbi:signal peptidase I [Cellulomonas timonensis]|uniref:signal peptidase I n=1 Tax=Cellulomonas timonensis TaxID=1689271 RepID=UPI00082C3934|nr:signal peptidase I [Cellulomonas timonensis]